MEGYNPCHIFFHHLRPIAEISLHFLSHDQTGSGRKSLQIRGIPWGPPGLPIGRFPCNLLFWGQPKVLGFLLLSPSMIMLNRTNREGESSERGHRQQ